MLYSFPKASRFNGQRKNMYLNNNNIGVNRFMILINDGPKEQQILDMGTSMTSPKSNECDNCRAPVSPPPNTYAIFS